MGAGGGMWHPACHDHVSAIASAACAAWELPKQGAAFAVHLCGGGYGGCIYATKGRGGERTGRIALPEPRCRGERRGLGEGVGWRWGGMVPQIAQLEGERGGGARGRWE